MGNTPITGIVDSHWSNRRPASRTDEDWIATQSKKLDEFFRISKEIQARALVHGGDLFNQPKGQLIDRMVDQWLMEKFRKAPAPWFTIPGNHDLFGHKVDSLRSHPYGCLEKAGLITSVMWPNYALIGLDPVILITGKEFHADGPAAWLESLRDEETLIEWKTDISKEYGVPVFALALCHGFFGPYCGYQFGEPITSYDEIIDTGIDVVLAGHDHSLKGVQVLEDDDGSFKYIIEPGALLRGTIAEKDIGREPKMVSINFESNGHHEIELITIAHDAPEYVFNFDNQKKEKKRQEVEHMFIEECRRLQTKGTTIDVLLNFIETSGSVSSRVASLTKEYLLQAEGGDL
jgi:DNA repair exonuclease SbcCD nuclease subunit